MVCSRARKVARECTREHFDVIIVPRLLMQQCMKVVLRNREMVPSLMAIHRVLQVILPTFFYAFFLCPGTMKTHAESINSDLQRGLARRLRHTTLNTEQNQLAIKVSAVTNTTATLLFKY